MRAQRPFTYVCERQVLQRQRADLLQLVCAVLPSARVAFVDEQALHEVINCRLMFENEGFICIGDDHVGDR